MVLFPNVHANEETKTQEPDWAKKKKSEITADSWKFLSISDQYWKLRLRTSPGRAKWRPELRPSGPAVCPDVIFNIAHQTTKMCSYPSKKTQLYSQNHGTQPKTTPLFVWQRRLCQNVFQWLFISISFTIISFEKSSSGFPVFCLLDSNISNIISICLSLSWAYQYLPEWWLYLNYKAELLFSWIIYIQVWFHLWMTGN